MRFPSSRRVGALVALASLSAAAGCATTDTRPAVATSEPLVRRYVLDYAHVPGTPEDADDVVRAVWADLRDGNAAAALQALELAPPMSRDSAAGQTASGLLALSRGDVASSRTHLQGALEARPGYAVALYGLGFLAEAQGNRVAGLDWYRQALAADPGLAAAAIRLQVLQLEQAQELIAQGELAEAEGDDRGALAAYESARQFGPQVLEPYVRIASIQRRIGDLDAAVATLRAARDRIGDLRQILQPLGDVLQESAAYADAYATFQALADVAPGDPEVADLVAAARELYFTTNLPEQYRQLERKPVIVREDLAALIAIQLEDLGDRVEDPLSGVIMVDIPGSWAEEYIRQVVAWRVMEPFQNHAFGTELEVSRMMFAEVAYRILDLIGATGGTPRVRPTDVSSAHYLYDRILVVIGRGVLTLGPRDTFGLLEPVSGAEATAAIQRLLRLVRSAGD